MRITLKLLILVFSMWLQVGYSEGSQPSGDTKAPSQVMRYDENSWKTMIPDSCLSYFDGCNNCRRSAAGEVAACTRKACFKYSKPECLDDAK